MNRIPVRELNADGHAIASYCIHITDPVPDEDNVLWQLLALQSDEEDFLRRANRSPLRVRRAEVEEVEVPF